MAEHEALSREEQVAELVERAGFITSVAGAGILTLVLLGNLYIIPLHHAPAPWLRVLVTGGPIVCGLIGFISTGSTWYGRGRVALRKKRYDIRDDMMDQALDAPGNLQDLPNRLGCARAGGPGLLAISAILCLFTFAPAPLGVIGAGINGANQAVHDATPTPVAQITQSTPTVQATVTPTPTARPTPTATAIPLTATPVPPTPTPTPVVKFFIRPTSQKDQCVQGNTAPPVSYTLDNTGSNVAVGWNVTFTAAPNFPDPWGTANATSGIIPAGKTATLTITPVNLPSGASTCASAVFGGSTLDAVVTLTKGSSGSTTISDTVFPQPST